MARRASFPASIGVPSGPFFPFSSGCGVCTKGYVFALPLLFNFAFLVVNAHAQVAISVGVGEIYDDNIFLEGDEGLPPDTDLETLPPEQAANLQRPENDNDPNSDFISNPYLALSGAIPLSKYYTTTAEGRIGGLIFADESDQNRVTLDGTLIFTATDQLLPPDWSLSIRDNLRSGSNNISVADGTATRQTQSNEAALNLNRRFQGIFSRTDLNLGYDFSRVDFMGTIGPNSQDDLDEDEGSDYFSNGLGALFAYHLSDRIGINQNNRINVLNFTDANTNDQGTIDETDLNRLEWNSTLGPSYTISDKLQFSSEAGYSQTVLLDDPEPRQFTIVNDDGTISSFSEESDKTTHSFIFSANLLYTPSATTSIDTGASQSNAVDSSGEAIIVRTIYTNISQQFWDKLQGILGGRFVQFNEGATVSDPTERYEASVSLKYLLSEAVALSFGYSYVNSDSGQSAGVTRFTDNDYEGNRIFVTLDTGFVATR